MPKLCKNAKCCGRYAFYAGEGDAKMLMPLTKVSVNCELRGALATTNVELTYVNPSLEYPYECTYTFPLEKTSTLAKFEAKIDDRII